MDPFVGEIRIFPFNFAPTGWAFCNGQVLSISQNTALFSLLGTNYGGDGRTTFALPNLQGSAPVMAGQGPGLSQRVLGEVGGETVVTLLLSEIPQHAHQALGVAANGDQASPTNTTWATAHSGPKSKDKNYHSTGGGTMNPLVLLPSGGDQPHDNLMPFLVLNFCIALQGIYPARP